MLLKFLQYGRGVCCRRESDEQAIEDLSGGFTGKGHCQDLRRRRASVDEGEIAIGQLKRFARAG
jgi:hypothetical protein